MAGLLFHQFSGAAYDSIMAKRIPENNARLFAERGIPRSGEIRPGDGGKEVRRSRMRENTLMVVSTTVPDHPG
jgi:hypothetical protein